MPCGNCNACGTRTYCAPFKEVPVDYPGIRFTADCFDCAIHLSIDTYSSCSFDCAYCFSNYLARNPQIKANNPQLGGKLPSVGALSAKVLEDVLDLSRDGATRKVLRDYIRGPGGKRKVVQWGALGDPFDNIERWICRGFELIKLFQKYEQPVRVSTKGGLLLQDKAYLAAIAEKNPHLFWFAFSTITIDDGVLEQVDRMAPNATQRLKAMKLLHDMGCRVSLRFRPILKNVSDATPKYPYAWRDLLRASRDAGAEAVSMEFVFVPGSQKPGTRARWDMIERLTGFPYRKFYRQTSDRFGSCLRSNRYWKEELTFAMREEAHKLGMVFSISDPHWKELNDTGNCCGMTEDDPYFGTWEKKQACMALVNARKDHDAGGAGLIHYGDVVPDWARVATPRGVICVTGPKGVVTSWMNFADYHHRHIWNDPTSARGPRIYFGGVLEPCGKDENGDIIYKYAPQARRNLPMGWTVRR